MTLPEKAAALVVSCDVFDTLLLRDHRSESRRFRDIASLASARLARELGIDRAPAAIWNARIEVQRHAYRALELICPTGDVRFADMTDAMAQILGVGTDGANILYEAEVAVERSQLTPNRPILTWLAAQVRNGCRVVAVSDTYHASETIVQLLDTLAPANCVQHVYTSADHNATKRTGTLFRTVLVAEGVAPVDVLHIGDDWRADIEMARVQGLRAVQVTRPRHLLLRRRTDAVRSRLLQFVLATQRRYDRTWVDLA